MKMHLNNGHLYTLTARQQFLSITMGLVCSPVLTLNTHSTNYNVEFIVRVLLVVNTSNEDYLLVVVLTDVLSVIEAHLKTTFTFKNHMLAQIRIIMTKLTRKTKANPQLWYRITKGVLIYFGSSHNHSTRSVVDIISVLRGRAILWPHDCQSHGIQMTIWFPRRQFITEQNRTEQWWITFITVT